MKLPKELKTSKDFNEKARNAFLNAYQAKFSVYQRASNYAFRYFFRGIISGVAFMLVISGTAVFADQQNVTPDNLLYSLKRSYESVNLVLSSEIEKPNVHLKYAERRLNEIKQIKKINNRHEKITSLVEDLKGEIKGSFITLENKVPEIDLTSLDAPVQGFGESINGIQNKSSPILKMTSSVILREAKSFKEDDVNDASGQKNKERVQKREKSKEQKDICKSWQDFISSEMPEIKQIIEDRPNFIRRFEKGCLLMTDSGIVPGNQEMGD
ncbi:MAG: DUF5667 domain-containing protein [Patescibacteria group bacterium]|nr:DUF5667 domain-containing protein [Patescibacteria group bacterium]